MIKLKINNLFSSIVTFICNLFLIYCIYALCRLTFFLENYSVYENTIGQLAFSDFVKGSLTFDTSAILYTNALYALLMLIPLHYKETNKWQATARWVFIITNSICVVANLIDCVYFKYIGHRTTPSVFQEFKNESNFFSIFVAELANHWYIYLAGIILIYLIIVLYSKPVSKTNTKPLWKYYTVHTIVFALYVPLTICGMRGGPSAATRPITISNANQYVNHPTEAALILNTPFAFIRTGDKIMFTDPEYFSRQELDKIYSPVHQGNPTGKEKMKKNVIVLIMESFGREYIGAYNKLWKDPNYKTYTPFVDSLFQHCLSFDYTFCNGRQSIDGMPSILSGIPRFLEPFFLTPASLNEVSGIAKELASEGYYTAFFHGAVNGSMGFQAYSRSTGFKDYFGRTEFGQDKRFKGDDEFDGTWAIWDEPFMQFYALKMNEMKEPFMTAIFTATSHQPYVIPEQYKDVYPEEEVKIHKCIRYVDNSLRKFFDTIKKEPWYKNTLFVIVSDHTNLSNRKEYQTELGTYGSPILFFDPSGEMPKGQKHCIAQQIDIMPTILNYLGYDKPYITFGIDLLNTPEEDTWAVNYNQSIYQYVKGNYVIQFDCIQNKTKAMYNFKTDWFMKKNLLSSPSHKDESGKTYTEIKNSMERELKALIQSYMERMIEDRLVYANNNKEPKTK